MDKNTDRPLVSAIIPMYGVEKYIGRCVTSLMTQTLDSIEFIFVDDCSPDKSADIAIATINKFPERRSQVRWIHHKKNKGLTAARNSGLAVATGKYIYHCDSDDCLHPQMLEILTSKAEDNNLDFVWCDFYIESPEGLKIEQTAHCSEDKIETIKSYLTHGWNVVWNTICRKEIYEKYNIKSLESISFCEDFQLMSRLLLCSSTWGKVCEPLYYYNRLNAGSIVSRSLSRKYLKKTGEDGICAVSSIYEFFRQKFPEIFAKTTKELNWNVLNAKKHLCFYPSQRRRYLSIIPECHADIDSNPLCSDWHKKMQHWIMNPLTTPLAWCFGLLFKIKHSF